MRIPLLFAAALLICAPGMLRAGDARPAQVPDTIEQRVLACAACHGRHGEGTRRNEYYPRLAGKPSGYLYNQLLNFRERRRGSAIMTYMVAYLSEPYLREIAAHYSQLEPRYEAPATAASRRMLERGKVLASSGDPARGLPGCAACHGPDLAGLEPAIPGLLGLSPEYIGAQIGAWRGGHRRAAEPDCMARIAQLLAPEDISAAAAWIASQRAPTQTRAAPAGSLVLPLDCGSVSQPSRPAR